MTFAGPLPTGLTRLSLENDATHWAPPQVGNCDSLVAGRGWARLGEAGRGTRIGCPRAAQQPTLSAHGAVIAGTSLCPALLQLSCLTALSCLSLELAADDLPPQGLAPLSSLNPGLTRLDVSVAYGAEVPPLSRLSGLQSLGLDLWDWHGSAHVLDTLPQLTRLTCLMLVGHQGVPQGLAALPLRRLLVHAYPGFDAPLPAGPYLATLAWLALPWAALQSSAPLLRNAPRLEYICTEGEQPSLLEDATQQERWHAFWELAATHPPLRCLAVGHAPNAHVLEACAALRGRHPALCLRTPRLVFSCESRSHASVEELLHRDLLPL